MVSFAIAVFVVWVVFDILREPTQVTVRVVVQAATVDCQPRGAVALAQMRKEGRIK
jgi:hypothetical protein